MTWHDMTWHDMTLSFGCALRQSHEIELTSFLKQYVSWYHWNCGRTQRKAATINQFTSPSYSLYVQLLWYPMYYPGGIKARISHVHWSKPYSILAPTQDSNPGSQIQNHKRWPLHYHFTHDALQISETCLSKDIWESNHTPRLFYRWMEFDRRPSNCDGLHRLG